MEIFHSILSQCKGQVEVCQYSNVDLFVCVCKGSTHKRAFNISADPFAPLNSSFSDLLEGGQSLSIIQYCVYQYKSCLQIYEKDYLKRKREK